MVVVERGLSGKSGKEVVSLSSSVGGMALSLSGKDAQIIKARRKQLTRRVEDRLRCDGNSAATRRNCEDITDAKSEYGPSGVPPEIIDIGLVGEPTHINVEFLRLLRDSDVIPVIAPVGVGQNGETFNINADTVAGAVASALKAEKLMLLTDVEGVLDKDKRLIPEIDAADIENLKQSGTISGGMIPKLDCCAKAVAAGCDGAYIVDGRRPHALLLEIFTDEGCGTEVRRRRLNRCIDQSGAQLYREFIKF